MNGRRTALLLLAGALLAACACDDLFPDDDFQPTGTPFSLQPGLAAVSITGGPRPLASGTYTIDITADAGASVNQPFPAGLLFTSVQRRVQHVVVLKDQSATFAAGTSRNSVGVFCCNRYRRTPDQGDTFALGPFTNHGGLLEIASLVRDRDISGHLWMVQRAVWMVTDSTGLNQAYRDSLAALPR